MFLLINVGHSLDEVKLLKYCEHFDRFPIITAPSAARGATPRAFVVDTYIAATSAPPTALCVPGEYPPWCILRAYCWHWATGSSSRVYKLLNGLHMLRAAV